MSDKEIEDLALEFAKAESYGEFSTDLWKGFVFGFKKAVKLLKQKKRRYKMKFDRNIYNIILVHVVRTWERLRLNQPHQEMPLDNIESAEELQFIADFVIKTDLVQEFLTNKDGGIWNKFGDCCSDVYIERIAREYITENYLKHDKNGW